MSDNLQRLIRVNRNSLPRWNNELFTVILIWLTSRIVVIFGMLVIAPLLPSNVIDAATQEGLPTTANTDINLWHHFTYFDGLPYQRIATLGYGHEVDKGYPDIAFFPFFPLVTRAIMAFGLPFEIAAVLLNNIAFVSALIILYSWVIKRHGVTTARWTIAVLSWFPYSIFTTIAYTEAIFILSTTAALKAFDNHKHIQAGLWGAIATATRVTGTPLIPTFLLIAWKERRPIVAYVAGLIAGVGILSFSIYCGIHFGDPLAFLHAQKAWGVEPGATNWNNWSSLLIKSTFIEGFFPAINSIVKLIFFLGGFSLLWYSRKKLSFVAVVYGFCYLALIFLAGTTQSVNRFVYAIVPLSIALGIVLANNRRQGVIILSLFALVLLIFSILSSQGRWVG